MRAPHRRPEIEWRAITDCSSRCRVVAVLQRGSHLEPIPLCWLSPCCRPLWTLLTYPLRKSGPELRIQPLPWSSDLLSYVNQIPTIFSDPPFSSTNGSLQASSL